MGRTGEANLSCSVRLSFVFGLILPHLICGGCSHIIHLCNSTHHAQGGSSRDIANTVTLPVDTVQRTTLSICFKPVRP